MTNLIEQVTFVITLHRDEHPDFPNDNILPVLRLLPTRGTKRVGYASVAWEKTGAFEIPEGGTGDN